ncbi:polymerase [Limosilactobacillus reuteri]|uniref:polymerase n=1 Tax=Limosilactobacillus reuteri TaxID=1598 RepID=UPI001CDB142D|nr:polymerase [Limosilactobacillus reuteri]MCC4385634.1 polymerase [Limosilactobacillus reuteri]MCC4468033.1 polymerase [Limosilactobacillus reuteri]MCC4472587.1 polymerase [Limosilactobacillus reuteri]
MLYFCYAEKGNEKLLKRNTKDTYNFKINGSQIFFIAFVIFFVSSFIQDTTLAEALNGRFLRLCSYISLPLLLFKIYFIDRWSKKELFVISILILLGMITWRMAHELQLLTIVPFVVGAKNVNFKDIITWYMYLNVILLLTMAIFSLLGIIPNLIYRAAPRPPRYSLGLIYTSSLATHYFYLVLAYCYLRFSKLRWTDYLLIIIGDVIFMMITNTKLDFIATLIVIPVMVIAQRAFRGHKLSEILASFWWMAVPITSSIIIFASYFYDDSNHIMKAVDDLTSGRLGLGHRALTNYDIHILGQTIVEHTYGGSNGLKLANQLDGVSHYFFIDSSYIRMFLLWGLLVFILIIVYMTYIAMRSIFRRTFVLAAIILIASLNFMFEPDIIKIIYDPFLLALFATPCFYKIQEEKDK